MSALDVAADLRKLAVLEYEDDDGALVKYGEHPTLIEAAAMIEHAYRLDPSMDHCPEWLCPDLSSEDRREGKTCLKHPCTCAPNRQIGSQ